MKKCTPLPGQAPPRERRAFPALAGKCFSTMRARPCAVDHPGGRSLLDVIRKRILRASPTARRHPRRFPDGAP